MATIVHDPGGLGFYIERLWAFVAVHDDGDEGVVGVTLGGMVMPAVAADLRRVDQLKPLIAPQAKLTGKAIKLVRFDRRVEIETFQP